MMMSSFEHLRTATAAQDGTVAQDSGVSCRLPCWQLRKSSSPDSDPRKRAGGSRL